MLISLAALLWPLVQEVPEDPFRGLWKPIDLDLKEVPAREAFEALFARAGTRLELPAFAEEKLTLRLQGATFWKALDQLCRAQGGLRIPPRPFHDQRRRIEVGPWIDFPVFYRGPLRFHLLDVGRIREVAYPRRLDRTDLTLMLSWIPDVTPVVDVQRTAGRPRLTRAEDDRGTSLLPVLEGTFEYDYSAYGNAGPGGCGWLIRLGPAAAGAKAVRILEGEWEGSFLGALDALCFQKPEEEVGKTLQAGPLLVTLARFGRRDSTADPVTYEILLKLGVDPSASAEWREGLKQVPLERRPLRQASCGVPPRPGGEGDVFLFPTKGADPSAPELRGWFRGAPGPLTIRVGRDPRTVKIPFAFENVRLPEEGR